MHDEYRKLRQWLHLEPDGPWPPSTAELLGLTPAEAAAPQTIGWTVLEARVLERMDWLRPYQLKYPELVTEGMNRLAQALLEALAPAKPSPAPPSATPTSTAPAEAPPEPPSEPPLTASTTTPLGGSPPPATPPPATAAPAQRPASGIAAPEADPLAPSLTAVSAGPPASSPSVSRAAPLEDSGSTHQVAPSVFAGLSLVSAPPLLSGPVPTSQGLLPDYPPGVPLSPQARARYRHLARPFFRRLVRLRRLWHLWQQTGHILRGTAWLERPLDLLRFYQLHRQLQPLLHSAEAPWGPTDPIPGWLTAAWLRHPQPVALLRWLSPPQRLQLLLDWHRGEQYLAQTCQQLHQQLQRHRQARRRAQRWTRLIRCLLRQPESWLLWALSLLLLITLLRSLRHG